MRWVMTRVLPLPAPARISTGPSTASDRLALLRVEPREDGDVWSTRARLLDRDGLGEVARLVHVAPGAQRHVVGEELERDHGQERRPQLRAGAGSRGSARRAGGSTSAAQRRRRRREPTAITRPPRAFTSCTFDSIFS